MTSDVQTLCAILRSESPSIPSGEARERLLTEARAHRVDRLVAWRANQIDDDLRAEAMLEELEVREVCRVLAGLKSRGIVPIVLKGAALAHTHYEQSWLRPRLDTDLLIASSHRQTVIDALDDVGYTRPPFISGELVMYQMPFERVGVMGQIHALDVHWRLANPQMLASLPDYDELSSRAVTVNVRDQQMMTPGPADTLLLACVHRAAHHDLSDELLWLFDIHLIAERFTTDDWETFVRLASRGEVRALCLDALRAAHRCFHTGIPHNVSELQVAAEPSAVYLRRDLTRFDRLLADLRALNYAQRIRLLAEHLLPPADYVRRKYSSRTRALLPFSYARRLVEGVGSWVTR